MKRKSLHGLKLAKEGMVLPSCLLLSAVLLLQACSSPGAYAQSFPRSVPLSDVTRMSDNLRDGGFTVAAVVVEALKAFVPYHTTMFIPSNDAIESFSNVSAANIPDILRYQVIDYLASSRALSRAPVGTRLPTLLPGKYLVLTSNQSDNLSINNVKVVRPNLCQTTKFVTCHGISGVLDPTVLSSLSPAASPEAFVSGDEMPSLETGGTFPGNKISPQDLPAKRRGIAPAGAPFPTRGFRGAPAAAPSGALGAATASLKGVCAAMLIVIVAFVSNLF